MSDGKSDITFISQFDWVLIPNIHSNIHYISDKHPGFLQQDI